MSRPITLNGEPVTLARSNARIGGNGFIRDLRTGLLISTNTPRAIRYIDLPDYNPRESDEQIREKLIKRFNILAYMTREAIDGRVRAMIASGPGGVGKTYSIDRELDEWDPSGEKYTAASGYGRMTGLYKMLWKHRNKGDIIKLDDMDSLFGDENALNMLKIACDTTKRRVLTYASEAKLYDENEELIPKRFEYEGTMIFITNLDFDMMVQKGSKLTPHFEALMTRSHYIDLMMKTKRDYLIRVFQVWEEGLFENMETPLTEEEENDVMEFIDKNYTILRECSLRMALKIAGLRQGSSEENSVTWQEAVYSTCCHGSP